MIRIRPFKSSDEEKVLTWCEDEDTFYKWSAGILGMYPITPKEFQKTSDMMRFVALDEKEVVGFFIVRNPKNTFEDLRFGFVLVDPNRRGQGIGKAMLQLGLKFAFEIYKAERVTLCVFEDNLPASTCYASIGFTDTGNREYYTINGEEWTCLEMEYLRPS